MKVRMRFIKRGPIQYIGHLDLMRYFQKVFRRCGLDVAYSKGFNPHQILSFASPLGVGLTSMGEYLDATLNSMNVVNDQKDYSSSGTEPDVSISNEDNEQLQKTGTPLTPAEWIDRINEYSNDMVIVTAFNIMPDDIKPSMSLLSAASYIVSFTDKNMPDRIVGFFNSNEEIMYTKVSKKSTSEINLKDGMFVVSAAGDEFYEKAGRVALIDIAYEQEFMKMMECRYPLYILCAAGSALNIKPEMLVEAYEEYIRNDEPAGNSELYPVDIDYDIIRLNMFTATSDESVTYTSMSHSAS